MQKLTASLNAWNTESFNHTLKNEIENLAPGILPLEQTTTQGGMVDDKNISATITSSSETGELIQVKTGIFFNEIIGGCSCGDDPASENAYCEIMISIDKKTATATFKIITE
ncbi:MAG: glucosamine--fructose-6-phosphate aminotransferase [Gammaproteobacteria bacterium]|nr:glucosamine--fructose-6-phosphate aminotransferase [Gammaproteobacteria bacterium]MDH5735586.1 glucosamine--fructose-6-phosphate aminotransferase [Gammaproteobacteria bacterium]